MITPGGSVLTGSAGEHYVLFQLLRRGVLASLSPSNAYLADIIAFSPSMSVGSMIQVKTRTRGRDGGWHMRERHEHIVHGRLFYVFVDLASEPYECYVVPSSVVAHVLQASHQAWLRGGRPDRPRQDNPLRRLLPSYGDPVPGVPDGWLESYRDRWDLLTIEARSDEARRSTEAGRMAWTVAASGVDPGRALIYRWHVEDADGVVTYQYVGRAKEGAVRRIREYRRNVENLLAKRPYRSANPDGYREVHRRLAQAVTDGHAIHLTYLCNVGPDEDIAAVERHWQDRHGISRSRRGTL